MRFHPDHLWSGVGEPWIPLLALLVLGGTAAWDARTGKVPNIALAIGAVAVLAVLWMQEPMKTALTRTLHALLFGLMLWLANEIWYKLFKRDAIGMGDAKWTALATLAFGFMPAAWAWLAGAWFGLGWMTLARLGGHKLGHVYFAPFLFCGLLAYLLFA